MADGLYKNHLLGDDIYPQSQPTGRSHEGMVVERAREITMGSDVCLLSDERLLLTWVFEVTFDWGILCFVRRSVSQDTWQLPLDFRMAL